MSIVCDQADKSEAEKLFELRYPGYSVTGHDYEEESGTLKISLLPNRAPICPDCCGQCEKVHDTRVRTVQDVPFLSCEKVLLEFPLRRVRCDCGCKKSEMIDWIASHGRVTNALVALVQNYLRLKLPISDIARQFGLHWDTVKTFDKYLLKSLFNKIDISKVRHIAIDEFSIHKGHKYATAVMDLETGQIIWVGKGKTQTSLKPFFDRLRDEKVDTQIESVSCDMNAAYPRMVKTNLPDARILYDFFHVMKKLNDDVIRPGRKKSAQMAAEKAEELKRQLARSGAPNGEVAGQILSLERQVQALKGSEWMIMTNPAELKTTKKEALDRLLKDNQLMASLYPLVDFLRQIWRCRSSHECKTKIQHMRDILLAISEEFGFKPAKKFAAMLKRREEGILWAGTYGYSSGRLEGANNKIKVLKRNAYGFKDFEYFALKIKSILPGSRSSPWDCFKKGYAVLKGGRLWKSLCFPQNS